MTDTPHTHQHPNNPQYLDAIKKSLIVKEGQLFATSRDVAHRFGKQHKDVLKAITNLECSPEFSRRNFAPSTYIDDRGKEQPLVELTRDGATILILGFTGKQAVRFRELYIEAFNQMEAKLHASSEQIDRLIGAYADLRTDHNKLKAEQSVLLTAVAQLTTGLDRFFLQGQPALARPSQQAYSSNVAAFLDHAYCQDSNAATDKEVIFALYHDYCQATATLQEPRDLFFKIIYQQGLPVRPGKLTVDGRITRVIRGFGIKSGLLEAAA